MRTTSQYTKPLADRHAERREQKLKYDRKADRPARSRDADGKFTIRHSKGK